MYLGKASAALTSFEIANQDLDFDDFKTKDRTLSKRLHSYQWQDKAFIRYGLDFLSEANYRLLIAMLRNRSALAEGLITIPQPYCEYPTKCQHSFSGITNPSSTHKISWTDSATLYAPTDPYTELSTGQYSNIASYDANDFSQAYTAQGHLLIGFDLANFITQFSSSEIIRLGLVLFGMQASPLKFYAWDWGAGAWYLIRQANYYDDTDFADAAFYKYYQSVAAFGLPWGYTAMYSNFVDSSTKKVWFRVEFPAGTGNIYAQHIFGFTNCFHVKDVGREAYNFRDSFTGAGRRGDLNLEEI